jgi:hypothetical protein
MSSNGMQGRDVRDLIEWGVNGAGQRIKMHSLVDWRWCNGFWHVRVTIVAGVTPLIVRRLTNS